MDENFFAYSSVDESRGQVLFFETHADLQEWVLYGTKTFKYARAITPDDLNY